ncbi:MAG: glycosyltransferase family 39 protein [Patescibacteria group bacterium]
MIKNLLKKVSGLVSDWGRLEKILLLVVLLWAAFFRLYRLPGYMEFLGDQGRDVLVVKRFLTQNDLMFIGPQTSIGDMYLGPWYYYLMAPALWLSGLSPVGPALMVVGFSLLSVFLAWWMARQWFGRWAGLVAGLIMTFSPGIIYYSIFSWNPNIMPFFSLLVLWSTWRVWQNDDFNKLPLLALALAMALNSHYLGLLLFPPVALLLLVKLVRLSRSDRSVLTGFLLRGVLALLVFLALMSPLFLFDLKHDWANFGSIWRFFTVRQTTVNLKFYKGLLGLPALMEQILANLFTGHDKQAGILLLVPLVVWGWWRRRQEKPTKFLLLFLFFGLLGLANYKQHVYAHYFGFFYPILVLLIAAGLKKFRVWGNLAVFLLLLLMLGNWHGWRPPNWQLKRSELVADSILEQSSGEKFAIALIAKANYDSPYRYFLELKDAPVVDLHEQLPEQLFVVCEPWGVECLPIGHPLWEIAAFGWAKIDREWELEGVKVFRLVHEKVN